MSKEERTGWRDNALSERHRIWGSNCPAVDIDFLLIEYDHEAPKALVEYKNEMTAPINVKRSPSILAMVTLANKSEIPAFLVRYATDFSWWKVLALNQIAAQYIDSNPAYMDEISWVRILYQVRGLQLPDDVRKEIETRTSESVYEDM